jgi:hypothetical protein
MNRPSALVRLAGYPPMTSLLLIGCGLIVAGWYQGRVSWWVGVAAIAAAGRTLGALKRVRVYKAWLADWQAMTAAHDAPPRPQKKWLRGGVVVITAVCIAVVIPLTVPAGRKPSDTLSVIWCVACLILVWKLLALLRRMLKRASSRAVARQAKADDEPVTWLLGRPSASPSRAEAERNLPEYCAGLISGSHRDSKA